MSDFDDGRNDHEDESEDSAAGDIEPAPWDLDFVLGVESYLPEIPEDLHSCKDDDLFAHCVDCGVELLDSGRTYLIQKAKRDGETILEMAICQTCASRVQGKVSDESREVLDAFVEKIGARAGSMAEGCCLACSLPMPPEGEFEIAALARGRRLMAPPLIICGACHEGLEESLSEETRRGGQEFIERNFPGVPADLGLPFSLVSG